MKLREEDIATDIRDMVANELRLVGVDVVEDGRDGENQPLSMAVQIAIKADIAVEIHMNASDNAKASGVESISNLKSQRLARAISINVAAVTKQKLRGQSGWIPQEASQHRRLAFVQAGGVIVEAAFISNDSDMQFFLTRKHQVAKSIASAILQEIEDRKAKP